MTPFQTRQRYREIRKVLWIVLFLNLAVASAKLVYGWITNSAGIMADGYHSFSDGASNIAGIMGIWLASKPRDTDHPYGHGKYETLSAVIIAFLLFLACFRVLSESINRFINPVLPKIDVTSFVIMAATLFTNIFVMRYEYKRGKALDSDLLVSDSFHTGSDIFITSSVIIGLIAVRAGYPRVDSIVAFMISFFIGFAGFEILKRSSRILVDAAAIDPDRIKAVAETIPEIKHCHKIRSRGRLGDIHVDMHCHMDPEIPLGRAHEIAHQLEDKIGRKIPGIKDITIHIEPCAEERER